MGDGKLRTGKSGKKHKKNDKNKITYHVGWTSGTIKLRERGRLRVAGRTARAAAIAQTALGLLLREAPLPSIRVWKVIVPAGTAAAFALLCWLIYSLLSYQ